MKVHFQNNEHGGIAIISALMLPVLIGAAALAVETGYWFMIQRNIQSAADMAAYSAALRLVQGDTETLAREGAVNVAYGNGLPRSTGQVEVAFLNTDYVEVVVTDTRNRFFTRIFLDQEIALSARAVARIRTNNAQRGVPVCMLSLSPDANRAVKLDGAAQITLQGCALEALSTSSSAFLSSGSSVLTAACVNLGGGAEGNPVILTECDQIGLNTSVRDIPRALLDMPDILDPHNVPAYGSGRVRNETLTPQDISHPSGLPMIRFRGGVRFQGNVVMQSGVYIFDGGQFTTQGATNIDASAGVVIYLMNGARLNFDNNTSANMRAMQYGPWANVLVFDSQDSDSRQTHVIVGARLIGAVYTPYALMEFGGGTGVDDGCFMLIADRFRFTGSANLTSDCISSNFDLDAFYTGDVSAGETLIDLVE
ncbi:pilus assembly protein TadG-related protein [Roseibaca sp. Y0-43]|uniref:pilus assembly protein TadG-related protein n=1 Tax=Roseibaca sp. Y0-43 TaxID=2816854 RepID=UPI001D0BFE48|nr:pilus assembly protein TadG-related protein [Roseibaca sp. Y0-43]MCC1482889.1 hypothetical protein [Roseibaca sp. Y0-43]